MFDGLKRSMGLRPRREVVLSSPAAGRVMPLSKVADKTFAEGLLGEGVAIQPSGNRVVSPADAKIEAVFPAGYAVALHTADGLDVLIHVGLGTGALKEGHFKVDVSEGDVVQRGDVLIEFDREAVQAEGIDLTVPVLLRNALEFDSMETVGDGTVSELDDLIVARAHWLERQFFNPAPESASRQMA